MLSFLSFMHLETFWAIIYPQFFCCCCFLSFWDLHYAHMGTLNGVLQVSELCSFFFITFFFSFFSLDWRISIDTCSSFLVLHSASLNLQSCSFSKTFHFSCCTKFFFFFGHTTWLVESQFPTRDWAWTTAVKVLSPNQWTTREFLWSSFFILGFIFMLVLFL